LPGVCRLSRLPPQPNPQAGTHAKHANTHTHTQTHMHAKHTYTNIYPQTHTYAHTHIRKNTQRKPYKYKIRIWHAYTTLYIHAHYTLYTCTVLAPYTHTRYTCTMYTKSIYPSHVVHIPIQMIAAGVFGGCYFHPKGGKPSVKHPEGVAIKPAEFPKAHQTPSFFLSPPSLFSSLFLLSCSLFLSSLSLLLSLLLSLSNYLVFPLVFWVMVCLA
jgi:hypothetical protein